MAGENGKQTRFSSEAFQLDSFRSADDEGIVKLFRAVDGEAYPIKISYDPEALTQFNASGEYSVVDILRRKGYFLGGLLHRWFDEDGLLMQKLLCPPDLDGIHLQSERWHQTLEMVEQDWGRAQSGNGDRLARIQPVLFGV